MKLNNNMVLEFIPLSSIDASLVQPDGRADNEQQVRTLMSTIQSSGICYPPLVFRKRGRFELMDGHRRVCALRLLGVAEVLCIILDATTPASRVSGFVSFNGATKSLQGNQRIQAWAKAEPGPQRDACLRAMRPEFRRQITELCAIIGEDHAVELAANGCALASVASLTRRLVKVIAYEGLEEISPQTIAWWILRRDMSRRVDTLLRREFRREIKKLHAAILANVNYPKVI